MKSIIALARSCAFMCCLMPCHAGDTAPPNLETMQLGGPEHLAWFASKVRQGKPVTIGFIGGSITQGAGASEYGRNYYWQTRSRIIDAVAKRGGTAKVRTAAIGGTGSVFGAFRIGPQLLDYDPDLLVVEFAVNDIAASASRPDDVIDGMEGIVRQALRRNPRIGILFFYTSSAQSQTSWYAKGLATPSVMLHHQVALHYGISEVLSGGEIARGMASGAYTSTAFFPDGVHPSDLGHALYARLLSDAMLAAVSQAEPTVDRAMPPLLGSGRYEYAHLSTIAPIGEATGWTKYEKQWNWYGVPIWTCDDPGKPITFSFTGQDPQLVFVGRLLLRWTVDGQQRQQTISGPLGQPGPSRWTFPAGSAPEGTLVSAVVVAPEAGRPRGEVWGVCTINPPADRH